MNANARLFNGGRRFVLLLNNLGVITASPSRLETRTKESIIFASSLVLN